MHNTPYTRDTPHTVVADPISALALQWSQRQSSVAVNAPRRKELKRMRRKIFSMPSLYLCLSLPIISSQRGCNATSAPDCNIGPPRDGETPRAKPAPPPRVLKCSFPLSTLRSTSQHFALIVFCFSLGCPRSRGHSRGGHFPLSLPLCVCRFGLSSMHAMHAGIACRATWFLSRLFQFLALPRSTNDGTTRWGQRDGTMPSGQSP